MKGKNILTGCLPQYIGRMLDLKSNSSFANGRDPCFNVLLKIPQCQNSFSSTTEPTIFFFLLFGPLFVGVSLDEADAFRGFLPTSFAGLPLDVSTTLLDKQERLNLRGGTAGFLVSSITSLGVRTAESCLGELSLLRFLQAVVTAVEGSFIFVVRGADLQFTARFEGEGGAGFSLGGSGRRGACAEGEAEEAETEGEFSEEDRSGISDFALNSTLSPIKVVTSSM